MADENTNKMNFFKRIITSIKDFDKYQIFALEKTSTAIKYLMLLMLIFSIVIAATFTYQFKLSIDDAVGYFNENIYEVNYKEETLSINEGKEIIILTDKEILPIVIINTGANEEQQNKYIEEVSKYDSGIILLNDKIIYKNGILTQDIEYSYKYIANNYGITEFNKQAVIDVINDVNAVQLYYSFFIAAFIYMFIIYFTSTLLDALMLAILGYLVGRVIGIKIKFSASFNMGIYALTLPIILNLIYIVVNTFTGFYVKYFQWMYTTISYIYMIVAILIIKTDLISRQIELMKIVEEQEKVRKELEEKQRKEEEEKNKEPKDNKEPEKEKKKDKKEKEDSVGDNGLAPQG